MAEVRDRPPSASTPPAALEYGPASNSVEPATATATTAASTATAAAEPAPVAAAAAAAAPAADSAETSSTPSPLSSAVTVGISNPPPPAPQLSPSATPAPGPIRTHPTSTRPVHSCSECRRKKLRCDRERPCQQCQKSRRTSLCNYDAVSTPRTKARGPYQRNSTVNGHGHDRHGEVSRFRLEAPDGKSSGHHHHHHHHNGSHSSSNGDARAAYQHDHKPSASYPGEEPGYAPVRHNYRPDGSDSSTQSFPETQSWAAMNVPRHHQQQQQQHSDRDRDHSTPRLPPIRTGDAGRAADDHRRENSYSDLSVVEDLQRRVLKLEEALINRHANGATPRRDASAANAARAATPSARPLLGGKIVSRHGRSKYRGVCDKTSMFWHFEEAVSFLDTAARDAAFKNELLDIQRRFGKRRLSDFHIPSVPDVPYKLAHELLLKMPSEAACKHLVSLYLDNFESVARILHLPDFVQQSERLWSEKQLPSDDFTPQLAAVIVIGSSLASSHQLTTADGQPWNVEPLLALLFAWEQRLPAKALTNFAILQTRCLLLISRQLLGHSPIEVAQTSNTLVRSAMAMGMQFDPSETPSIGPFYGELRRRLWYSIVEIDLQASLCCGLQPAVQPEAFTTRAPVNVDDRELMQIMTAQPGGRPLDQWTDCTYQVILARTLQQRLQAAGARLASADVYPELAGVQQTLSDFGTLRNHRVRPVKGAAGDIFGDMLLESYLLRSVIAGLPNLNYESAEGRSIFDSAFRGCQSILSNLEQLEPNIIDAAVFASSKYWNIYEALCNDQIIQAALILTAAVESNSSGQRHPRDVLSVFSLIAEIPNKSNILRTVDGLVASLTTNVDDLGRHLKDIVCLALALQCVRSLPDARDNSMREAIHRTIERCNYRSRHEAGNYHATNQAANAAEDDTLMDLFGFDLGLDVDSPSYEHTNGTT